MKKILLFWAVSTAFFENKCTVNSAGLKEEFTWTRMNYAIPTFRPVDVTAQDAAGAYIYENNMPVGASRWKDKLFITLPRRGPGVPSTLNYVLLNSTNKHNVPLIPYPSAISNQIIPTNSKERLVSVYRPVVDQCDRLWMVDTGILEYPRNKTKIGPQRIVIIDLNTNKIVKTYNFKQSDLACETVLTIVTVDVAPNNCDDAYAYFPDLNSFGLVVYSLKQDDSWRVLHNYFHLEPLAGEFFIGGIHFSWDDGIFSGALTDLQKDGYRTYIFHAMAGTHLYGVSTKILRDKKLATKSYHGNDFFVIGDRGNASQSSATDIHKPSSVLFLNMVNQNAVGCWNIKKPFGAQNFGIVHRDDNAMIYASDLKIYQDDIIVLTNRMPIIVYSKLNYDEINFRVFRNNVYDAIAGTVCASTVKDTIVFENTL